MDIVSNRISATPRSKYHKYNYGSSTTNISSGGSATIDTSNFVKLRGQTSQTIEGNILSTGDIVAYATTDHDINLPIASSNALGVIKIGEGLTISEDGTVTVTGGLGGGGTVSEWGDITGTLSNQTDLWNVLQGKANTSDLHSHSNKSVLDGITSTLVNHWNTAYTNNHNHSNKSYLDYINQNLSSSGQPNFRDLTVDYNIVAEEDIYANNSMFTQTLTAYTKVNTGDVSATGDVVAKGDVIAYSTGTSSAPFKFWKPSVSSSGVLSWTNTTSETTPTSVNIKGAAGEDGASLTYQWSGTSLRIGTTKNGSTSWGSYVNLKGTDGADGSSFSGGTTISGIKINSMFYEGGALKGSIYCTGSGSWEAAQIMLENTAISNYGRRWKIMLGGSSAQNGDLTFQCDNGSAGSASVSPYYRVKFTKHTTSNAVQAAGAYSNASDIRLKNIISPYHNSISTLSVDTTNNSILDKISNLNSYYFNWKTPNEIKPNSISEEEENELKNTEYYSRELLGFVAQELKEVFPEFVYGEESETDVLSIDYAGLGAVVAIEGLKELNIKLENKINQLEQKITLLESKLK